MQGQSVSLSTQCVLDIGNKQDVRRSNYPSLRHKQVTVIELFTTHVCCQISKSKYDPTSPIGHPPRTGGRGGRRCSRGAPRPGSASSRWPRSRSSPWRSCHATRRSTSRCWSTGPVRAGPWATRQPIRCEGSGHVTESGPTRGQVTWWSARAGRGTSRTRRGRAPLRS